MQNWKCFCSEYEGRCDSCEVREDSPATLLVGAGLITAVMFGLPWIIGALEAAAR